MRHFWVSGTTPQQRIILLTIVDCGEKGILEDVTAEAPFEVKKIVVPGGSAAKVQILTAAPPSPIGRGIYD